MDNQDMKTPPSAEQKTLYNLYALFGFSIILCFIPYVSAAILCVVFFMWLLIATRRAGKNAEEHSLVHNHAVFITRTIWIGAFMTIITMIFASLYLFGQIDYAAFNPCTDAIAGQGIEALEAMGYGDIYDLAKPCIDDFIALNYNALIVSVGIAAGLPLIYLAYRFFKGAGRAIKGYRLAEPKNWL